MFERITQMLIKEFIQILRDPRMRTVIFVMPLVQTLVFGYAVTTDVTHIPTAIFDLDNSRASRELAARFVGSGYFDVVAYVDREEKAWHLVDRGVVKAVLRMNKGSGRISGLAGPRRCRSSWTERTPTRRASCSTMPVRSPVGSVRRCCRLVS